MILWVGMMRNREKYTPPTGDSSNISISVLVRRSVLVRHLVHVDCAVRWGVSVEQEPDAALQELTNQR